MTSIWDNVMARTTEKLDNWKGETIRATQGQLFYKFFIPITLL